MRSAWVAEGHSTKAHSSRWHRRHCVSVYVPPARNFPSGVARTSTEVSSAPPTSVGRGPAAQSASRGRQPDLGVRGAEHPAAVAGQNASGPGVATVPLRRDHSGGASSCRTPQQKGEPPLSRVRLSQSYTWGSYMALASLLLGSQSALASGFLHFSQLHYFVITTVDLP
jgi:hypothetical protein